MRENDYSCSREPLSVATSAFDSVGLSSAFLLRSIARSATVLTKARIIP